jgi:hypothetical protein
LQRLIAQDDWASAWLQAEAIGEATRQNRMDYCWLMRVADKQVVEVVGFYN